MPINYTQLRLEIARQSENAIYAKVKPIIKETFEEKKGELLENFDNHEVTRELEDGPDASSSFIDTNHGGNLYSLIGFGEGENPTDELRDVLEKNIKLNLSQTKREVKSNIIEFKTSVIIPTISDVNEEIGKRVKLKWTSRPFTDLIEKGITGFSKYLFRSEGFGNGVSESGTAIETKKALRQGSVPRIRYISDILKKFRDSILRK